MNKNILQGLLQQVLEGELESQDAAGMIEELYYGHHPQQELCLDHEREQRCGFGEVVYAEGKTEEQCRTALASLLRSNGYALATRMPSEIGIKLAAEFSGEYHYHSRCLRINSAPRRPGNVLICSGGTSDSPVTLEASDTLHSMGIRHEVISDVGVAGIHRLLKHQSKMQHCDAIIAIAGMEGALPSVIGGLTKVPVIAVPTSVGYGCAQQGMTALHAMLSSCSSGITVVNIDNGFGAAYAVLRLLISKYAPHIEDESPHEF